MAVRYFGCFLKSRDFRILTDHKPLAAAFKSPMINATPRQVRHLQYLQLQNTQLILHIQGVPEVAHHVES